ncbi:MAG: hypothetical protein ACTHJ4_00760 [Candidatus Nucleicultricaceae bacterium]
MRKIFTQLWAVSLLCLTPALFNTSSLFASADIAHAEKKITVVNESTDSMASVLGILQQHGVNLKETAFFFDFDETIATKIAAWNGHTYHLLASPDLYRTYGTDFRKALSDLKLDANSDQRLLRPTDTLGFSAHYVVLDDSITSLITHLKTEGAHVGVCSALAADATKLEMLRKVGIDPNDYTYASGGKAATIEQYLQHNLLGQKISTIVLIDNSFPYALKAYSETMGPLAKTLPQTKDVPEIKIIGIEFTKFNKMATTQNMKEELETMMGALGIK